MRSIPGAVFSAFVLIAAAGNARAALITLTYDDVDTSFGIHQYNPTLDGISHTISGSQDGSSSTTTTNYGQLDASTVRLEVTGNHTHSGAAWTYLYSTSQTGFIANQDSLTYAIDGGYRANAGAIDFARVDSRVSLIDLTLGQLVLESHSISGQFLNLEQTVAGGLAFGNVTGALIHGHHYAWNTYMIIDRREDAGTVVEGSGGFTLTVSRAADVPEPASLTLFGLGALGLAAARKHKLVRSIV